jgi:hypothetical protein
MFLIGDESILNLVLKAHGKTITSFQHLTRALSLQFSGRST